ncbi:MAG: DUF58 domain-containing protein [Caldilineaceae bacterium]|nr:DUF58 domain-containing protein [Caldilineaceae bacterium]
MSKRPPTAVATAAPEETTTPFTAGWRVSLGRQRRLTIDTSKDTQSSEAWLVVGVLLSVIGVASNNLFFTASGSALWVIVGISWLWSKWSMAGLRYERTLSELRAFQGETIQLTLAVRNQKLLPLPWLRIRDTFPPDLPVADKQVTLNPGTNLAEFHSFWMLGAYQRLQRTFPITCATRGFHYFGPATLSTGDGFGFFDGAAQWASRQRLIIYPRLYSVAELQLPSKSPFGEVRAPQSLFEDPLRTVGIREWQSSDSQRRVHWKATARHQQLLSRVYEPSEEQQLQIFLNVATLERHWHGYLPELQERAISVAGSLAALAIEERRPTGIIANGVLPGSDQPIRLLPGRNPNQLIRILELLAAVTPFATTPIENLLVEEAPRMPWGATLVVVTAIAHSDLLATLLDLAAAGRRLVLFTLAEEAPSQYLGPIPVFHLPHLLDDLIAPRVVA